MKPSEHKTVQARILKYAEEIGWIFVPRKGVEERCGFDPEAAPTDRAKDVSLFFDDLLDVPNHGKWWKSLMRVHLGDYEKQELKLRRSPNITVD